MTRFTFWVLLGAAIASMEFHSRCAAQVPVRLQVLPPSSSASGGVDAGFTAPNYSYLNDPRGSNWRVQPDGSIEIDNGNQGQYGRLMVNSLSFSPSTRKMAVKGGRYVHAGKCGPVEVTRTLEIDLNGATARFVDVYTNPGPTELKDLGIVVNTTYRSGSHTFKSDLGNQPTGILEPRASGVVAAAASHRGFPLVAVFLASPRSKVRPALSVDRNQSLQAAYHTTIPAGGSVAVVTAMRLHRPVVSNQPANPNPFGGPALPATQNADPKSFAEAHAPFREKAWLGDVPREVRRKLINYLEWGAEQSGGGMPFQQLDELLERAGIAAAESDVLLLDDASTISGTTTCGPLTITTAYGKSEFALDDVAALIGGGGTGRKMQLYLRTGEILGGTIETGPFLLTNAEGLKVELVPALMHLLVLKKKEVAPQPPPAYLTTVGGDRLGVRIHADDRLTAATPWGAFSVSFENVESLVYRLEPQPMMHLTLRNRSRLPVFLTGPSLEWETLRYGRVPLANHAIRRWDRTLLADAKAQTSAAADSSTADDTTRPHLRISDEAIVYGSVVETELRLSTATGVKTLDTRAVSRLERNDDGEVECDTVGSPLMHGRIASPSLTVTVDGVRLKVPARHIQSFRGVPADADPFKN